MEKYFTVDLSSLKRLIACFKNGFYDTVTKRDPLTVTELETMKYHKYKSVDINPWNSMVAMPFCDGIVKRLPLWLHPNTLTLTTLALTLLNCLLLSVYDWHFYASTSELWFIGHIPNWVWLFIAINLMVCNLFDSLDGKQARRLGCSSVVGELLDHCMDSWRLSMPLLTIIFSLFGRGEYGLSEWQHLHLLMSAHILTVAAFWLQLHTGTFYCTISHDIAQYTLAGFCLHTFCRGGAMWWQGNAIQGYGTNAQAMQWFIYSAAIVPSAIHLVFAFIWDCSMKSSQTVLNNLMKSLSFLMYPIMNLAVFYLWAQLSNSAILTFYPRMFYWALATNNVHCVWIILMGSLAGKKHAAYWSKNFVLLIFCFCCSMLQPSTEIFLFFTVTLLSTLSFLYTFVITVIQIASYNNAPMFKVIQKLSVL